MSDLNALGPRLDTVIKRQLRQHASLGEFFVFEEGHAGLTLGFSVLHGAGEPQNLVLKLAPPGVRRKGNTDVYRQAPLLKGLHAAGVAVPDIVHASPDEDELGTPYVIMERLAGRSFVIWEPHATFDLSPTTVAPLWRQAAKALARLHQVDWRALEWGETPRPLAEEIAYWNPILEKSPEPRWIAAGIALADALARSMPRDAEIGIVHGDYQPGNILYENGTLTGIIDWELAGIGAQALDVGWLLMMADTSCWHAGWKPHVGLAPSELLALYEKQRGRPVANAAWFQALACYRMGAIACLNVRLHRSGRRPDPLWDRFAPSIDTLFARGMGLIA